MGEAKRCALAVISSIHSTKGVSRVHGSKATEIAIGKGIQELARRAFEAQGAAAFENPIEAAAIHESGHCVIHRYLGDKLKECRIEKIHHEGGDNWVGVTHHDLV